MRDSELVPLDRPKEHPTMFRGVRDGLAYVRSSRPVRAVLLMTVVLSTIGFNFHVLVPVLASETLKAGPEVFGIISACFGAGALAGALLQAAFGRASWKATIVGSAGFGVSLLALAPQTSVLPVAALLFVTGVCFTLWTANSQSILQLTAPDHLRGRVLSLWLFAFAGLAPVGGLVAGWLADVGGTQLAFAVAGSAGLVIAGLALAQRPYRKQPRVAADAQAEQTLAA
jgi:MFS family permease